MVMVYFFALIPSLRPHLASEGEGGVGGVKPRSKIRVHPMLWTPYQGCSEMLNNSDGGEDLYNYGDGVRSSPHIRG